LADGWEQHLGCQPLRCEVHSDETHIVQVSFWYETDMISIMQCADGYTVDGTPGGSTWLEHDCDLPSCRPVTCVADNLMIALYSSVEDHRDYTIGQRATYRCMDGYSVAVVESDTFEVECLRSGLFSAMSTCRNIDDCVELDGHVHSCGSNGFCVDGINDYSCQCESGFEEEMVGDEKMCGNIDDCGVGACGAHGACHDLVNGYECECDVGYELHGEGDARICLAKVCQMPSWDNVVSSVAELRFPETLYVECAEGHDLGNHEAHFQIECSADGVITFGGSATMPQCRPKVCGHPPQVHSEHQEVRDYVFGETSVSVCQGGDVQIVHECGADGQFRVTSEFHTCQNSCGAPTAPAHSIRVDGAGAVYHPNTAQFTCNSGYTPNTNGSPGGSFSQTCRANGAFTALTEGANGCVPVVCQRPSLPAHWEWVNNGALNTQSSSFCRCANGYTSMQGQFEITCGANGQVSALPDPCQPSSYTISGRIRNAVHPTSGVASATLVIAGQTITSDSSGHYSVNLAQGTHTYSLNAHGFITIESGSLTVNAAGTFDITMSPLLAADSWRIVLSWDQNPRDLDSHLLFYGEEYMCPEMYYGRRSASCAGVTAALDVDDTSSWGPETTTLSNVNSCGWLRQCKWVYKVKNYSGYYDRTHGWQHSQAKVMLYNGDHLVREFEVNSNHGHRVGDGIGSPDYWSVLSIDRHGNVEECSNANCD